VELSQARERVWLLCLVWSCRQSGWTVDATENRQKWDPPLSDTSNSQLEHSGDFELIATTWTVLRHVIPTTPKRVKKVTATHPWLYLGADANWKVKLMCPFHKGDNWWGYNVVVKAIAVLLPPYSSTLSIRITRIIWLLCNSVVDATKRGPWCVEVTILSFMFEGVFRHGYASNAHHCCLANPFLLASSLNTELK
jgi:hypothetical protein